MNVRMNISGFFLHRKERLLVMLVNVVLAVSCLNLCSFAGFFRRLTGANKGGSAAMGVLPLMILCSIISLAFFLISSSEDQFSLHGLCSMSVPLLRLRESPTTKRAERHCTASNFIVFNQVRIPYRVRSLIVVNCDGLNSETNP